MSDRMKCVTGTSVTGVLLCHSFLIVLKSMTPGINIPSGARNR